MDVTFEGENPGVWVERQCEAIGVSVTRVAREAGVSRETIWRWKTGDCEPKMRSFERLRVVVDSYWAREKKVGGF